jgi:phosphatidylserine/phosphatidylglycerophosphate/cardiolipin synthase-like enzyme
LTSPLRPGYWELFLKNARIPTYIDDKHAIAHDKIIIIDREIVITGSCNFTKAAEEKNAENVLIITDKSLLRKSLSNRLWSCVQVGGRLILLYWCGK